MITSSPPATAPNDNGALFRPIRNNRTGRIDVALDPDMIYKLVQKYSAELGFEIGAHALRATAATNALDHQADIAKVQEWLGHANIATTRIYDHRKTRPEDSPTFKVNIDRRNLKHNVLRTGERRAHDASLANFGASRQSLFQNAHYQSFSTGKSARGRPRFDQEERLPSKIVKNIG
jgi:hypothetical protein